MNNPADASPRGPEGSGEAGRPVPAPGGNPLPPVDFSDELRRLLPDWGPRRLDWNLFRGFLGPGALVRRRVDWGILRVALLWKGLRGHVEGLGGRWHGVTGHLYKKAINPPEYRAIEQAPGEWLDAPEKANVFLECPEGRVILWFGIRQCECCVGVEASATFPVEGFFRGWEEHVRASRSLRGRAVLPSGKWVEFDRSLTWDDLYLPASVKDEVRRQVTFLLRNAATLSGRFGVRRRRGVILAGRPGTGKTLIGRILSATLGETVLWATPAFLRKPEDVERLLDLARLLAPTVLFLEDVDMIAEDRFLTGNTAALAELMNQLDGYAGDHAIVTVATTNRPEAIEEAIRNRPGRFDRVITIPSPDPASARGLLARRLAGHALAAPDLDWLAAAAAGRTGAELEELANTALLLALERARGEVDGGLKLDREVLAAALAAAPGGSKAVGFVKG